MFTFFLLVVFTVIGWLKENMKNVLRILEHNSSNVTIHPMYSPHLLLLSRDRQEHPALRPAPTDATLTSDPLCSPFRSNGRPQIRSASCTTPLTPTETKDRIWSGTPAAFFLKQKQCGKRKRALKAGGKTAFEPVQRQNMLLSVLSEIKCTWVMSLTGKS